METETRPRDLERAGDDGASLVDLYRRMVLIRLFEEKAEEMYTRAKIGGYCHLNIGEEASVVGTIDALRPDDYLFASYRDHGVALARGSDPARVMAELFGREDGVAHGRGGSMHLVDVPRRFMGGYGIVGGQLPLAVGAALAIDYRDGDEAVLCLLGEGAVNMGAFHESLNLASVYKLPIVFVVVNNLYGMGTGVARSSAEPEVYRRAAAYRMPGERIDGMDVLAVRAATASMLARAREDRTPCLLETVAYRFRGHSVADAGKVYRSAEELASWRTRDPIIAFRSVLEARGLLSADDAVEIDAEAARVVQQAVEIADASPVPDVAHLYDGVYGPLAGGQFARMGPGGPLNEVLPGGMGGIGR